MLAGRSAGPSIRWAHGPVRERDQSGFGAVHGIRQKGPCLARRDKPVCPHGRPLWCTRRHTDEDPRLGEPLCVECYDYTAHVVWQWYAPELWRRFTIALQRHLAHQAGHRR